MFYDVRTCSVTEISLRRAQTERGINYNNKRVSVTVRDVHQTFTNAVGYICKFLFVKFLLNFTTSEFEGLFVSLFVVYLTTLTAQV